MQAPKVSLSATNSVRSHRRLHTAFWSHGAAGVELFSACQSLLRGVKESESMPFSPNDPEPARLDPLEASTFLLDFLYPNGAGGLIRSLSRRTSDRRRSTYSRGAVSSLSTLQLASCSSSLKPIPHSRELGLSAHIDLHQVDPQDKTFDDSDGHLSRTAEHPEHDGIPHQGLEADHALLSEDGTLSSDSSDLRVLLRSSNTGNVDRIWHAYSLLDSASKDEFRLEVLSHLATSGRAVEAWRIAELFAELDVSQWTDVAVLAAIKANLGLNNVSRAVDVFARALGSMGFVRGLDMLLAYAFKTSSWRLVIEVWDLILKKFDNKMPAPQKFKETAEVPQLSAKVAALYEYAKAETDASAARMVEDRLDRLLSYISTENLRVLEASDAASILERVGRAPQLEKLIAICIEQGKKNLAVQLYHKYRLLPNVKIRVFVLRQMIEVFYPHDVRGMELVLKDWYQSYERLDGLGYHKFLSFYARRGDVKTVLRLRAEYKKHYPTAHKDRISLSALMLAHAVRGEADEASRVLVSSWRSTRQKPGSYEWNILLNAYAKAWDVEKATKLFEEICEAGYADNYTFGTFMIMLGGRGDLQSCLDLYRRAKKMGLTPDLTMLDAVVEAYCQNDMFLEAEHLCTSATRKGHIKGNYTILFNTLLDHLARRRDLTNVNRILQLMAEFDVKYDNKTYEHLLQALVNCRQSHHALQLVETARETNAFVPTLSHYLLVMSAFLRSREPHLALRVGQQIEAMDDLGTADRMTKVIEALSRWREMPERLRKSKDAGRYVEEALDAFRQSLGREERTVRDDRRAVSRQYSKMIFFLTQMRDFASVHQIIRFYRKEFPEDATKDQVPLNLLSSVMLADFYEGQFDRVKATWSLILQRTRSFGAPAWTRKGVEGMPARCYVLNDPLKTMQRMYLAEQDADGLIKLVASVRAAGFALDSKNWNYYVQALARLKKWEEAFTVCEEVLMPQWTGWLSKRAKQNVKNQLPLEVRRLGSSPHHIRPISYTLLVLAKEYLELEKRTPWSVESARLFARLNDKCARVVQAIKTMTRIETEWEQRIFDDQPPPAELEIRNIASQRRAHVLRGSTVEEDGAADDGWLVGTDAGSDGAKETDLWDVFREIQETRRVHEKDRSLQPGIESSW
ncbi:hypothetical protein VTK73DRAFT_10401 [Phialemonium thermophilum]|uniref:Uncharacterized protein n=1 Tax=Phialemonium thermophilum TaxID=223376 RepID=A0ABR3XG55_9PEZI